MVGVRVGPGNQQGIRRAPPERDRATLASASSESAEGRRTRLLIVTGIMSAGMGLKGFLFSSHFIDGGVTGISMLLSKVTPISLSIWLPVVTVEAPCLFPFGLRDFKFAEVEIVGDFYLAVAHSAAAAPQP